MGVEKVTVLGRMTTDDGVFGEISYLEGGSATASVVADEDETSVYIIEGMSCSSFNSFSTQANGAYFFKLRLLFECPLRAQPRLVRAVLSLLGTVIG